MFRLVASIKTSQQPSGGEAVVTARLHVVADLHSHAQALQGIHQTGANRSV